MANANPFSIEIAPLKGLNRLTDTVKEIGQRKYEEGQRQKLLDEFDEIKEGAVKVFQEGDPDKILEYGLLHPEMAQAINLTMGYKDKKVQEAYVDATVTFMHNPTEDTLQGLILRKEEMTNEDIPLEEETEMHEWFKADPEGTVKMFEMEMALREPDKYKSYKSATKPAKRPTPYGKEAKVIHDRDSGYLTPEVAEAKINLIRNPQLTPYTNLAKVKEDYDNGKLTAGEYNTLRDKIINPKATNKVDLTRLALEKGKDSEEARILIRMAKDAAKQAGMTAESAQAGKLKALYDAIDGEGTARAIYEGREVIDSVRNTFGVPLQEAVRKRVLEMAKKDGVEFNFIQPRAYTSAMNKSLGQMQKNRNSMGSFINNMDTQIKKMEDLVTHVSRTDARILNMPWREAITKLKGSGHEKVLEMFLKEISAEAAKLSQSATGSVALLPEEARKEWESVHDPNLNVKELMIVLEGTKHAGEIRLDSVDREIDFARRGLEDVNKFGRTTYYDEQWKRQGGASSAGSASDPEGLFN